MTTITVEVHRVLDAAGGRGAAGAQLEVGYARTSLTGPAVLVTGKRSVELVDGVGQFEADPTPVGQALVVDLLGAGKGVRFGVVVPAAGTHALTSLQRVDLASLGPDAAPPAAWDLELLNLSQATAVAAQLAEAAPTVEEVEDLLEDLAPGTELAFIELPAAYQTSQTNIIDVVPGMTVTIVGTGRPVEVEFYAPSVTHSAGGDIVGWVFANSAPFSRWSQVSTAKHGGALVVRERIVIPVGFQVTFGLYVYANSAGTVTVSVTDFIRPHLSVVAR